MRNSLECDASVLSRAHLPPYIPLSSPRTLLSLSLLRSLSRSLTYVCYRVALSTTSSRGEPVVLYTVSRFDNAIISLLSN